MTTNSNVAIREYLQEKKLITDGSFGTYYGDKYETQQMPEFCNFDQADFGKVVEIHREYIKAGAHLIRTNTFATNSVMLDMEFDKVQENIKNAVNCAKEAVADAEVFIAGDIGPIPSDLCLDPQEVEEEYYKIAKTFVEKGISILTFETFPDIDSIVPAIKRIKAENDVFVMVQFSINQYGYTKAGIRARKLFLMASQIDEIDAVGLNCGVGPGHMEQIMSDLLEDWDVMEKLKGKYIFTSECRISGANKKSYYLRKASGLFCQQTGRAGEERN